MKLYETLEKQLKKEPNYISDNGELKKWVVIAFAPLITLRPPKCFSCATRWVLLCWTKISVWLNIPTPWLIFTAMKVADSAPHAGKVPPGLINYYGKLKKEGER